MTKYYCIVFMGNPHIHTGKYLAHLPHAADLCEDRLNINFGCVTIYDNKEAALKTLDQFNSHFCKGFWKGFYEIVEVEI